MRKLLAISALLASLGATPTAACSLENWNVYESVSQPSLARLTDEAATIDWVSVDAGPVACPRSSPVEVASATAACPARREWSEGDFSGRVVERLKGASGESFPLVRWSGNRWEGFSDVREMPDVARSRVAVRTRAQADSHAALLFWDEGALSFSLDGANSCGGSPVLDPGNRYVVFRDASGSVIALEPVLAGDDRLLQRLRARRNDHRASMREPFPVESLFRDAFGLVLTRVNFCRGGGRDADSERARLTTLRGSPEFLFMTQDSQPVGGGTTWYEHGAPGAASFRFDYLSDSFAARGQGCPSRGSRILLLRPKILPSDSSAYSLDRPIPVAADGTISVADIFTALELTGAERVSVDQAFVWFEESRSVRP